MIKIPTPLIDVQIGQLIRVSNDLQMTAYGKVVSKFVIGGHVAITATDTAREQFRTCSSEKGYVLITSLERPDVDVVTLEDEGSGSNPRTLSSHADLIALFNQDPDRELHLHYERDCGTHRVAFYIATEDEKLAEGTLNIETDDDGDYLDELAFAVFDECNDDFASITEYDSLVAGTNPGTVR